MPVLAFQKHLDCLSLHKREKLRAMQVISAGKVLKDSNEQLKDIFKTVSVSLYMYFLVP